MQHTSASQLGMLDSHMACILALRAHFTRTRSLHAQNKLVARDVGFFQSNPIIIEEAAEEEE